MLTSTPKASFASLRQRLHALVGKGLQLFLFNKEQMSMQQGKLAPDQTYTGVVRRGQQGSGLYVHEQLETHENKRACEEAAYLVMSTVNVFFMSQVSTHVDRTASLASSNSRGSKVDT